MRDCYGVHFRCFREGNESGNWNGRLSITHPRGTSRNLGCCIWMTAILHEQRPLTIEPFLRGRTQRMRFIDGESRKLHWEILRQHCRIWNAQLERIRTTISIGRRDYWPGHMRKPGRRRTRMRCFVKRHASQPCRKLTITTRCSWKRRGAMPRLACGHRESWKRNRRCPDIFGGRNGHGFGRRTRCWVGFGRRSLPRSWKGPASTGVTIKDGDAFQNLYTAAGDRYRRHATQPTISDFRGRYGRTAASTRRGN